MHRTSGAASPAPTHAQPATHARQSLARWLPVALEKVPDAHAWGAVLPLGQKWPAGHTSPVAPPSRGAAWRAPSRQKNPAAQAAVGAPSASPAQYMPPVHAVASADPAGQNEPASQAWPVTPSVGRLLAAPPRHT